jgi:hypothetical protein
VFVGQIAPMLAQVVPPAEFAQRSQILGLALSRYVLKVPPVVALDRVQIIDLVGPTLQRYLAGKL